jgi:hypothetical protein
MEIRYAVLADSANVSREGKMNITGIFDQVNAVTFPAAHPGASLAIGFEAHGSEVGVHNVLITFADADGQRIMQTKVELTVHPPNDASQAARGGHVLPIPLIPLPTPGDYTFDVFVDGRYATSIPLAARQVPDPQAPPS